MAHLKSRGVGCHVHFVPTHLHPAYSRVPHANCCP